MWRGKCCRSPSFCHYTICRLCSRDFFFVSSCFVKLVQCVCFLFALIPQFYRLFPPRPIHLRALCRAAVSLPHLTGSHTMNSSNLEPLSGFDVTQHGSTGRRRKLSCEVLLCCTILLFLSPSSASSPPQ